MIRKSLFLLEYMVKSRIEKDTERLEAIKNIGKLLSEEDIDIENIIKEDEESFFKKINKIKGRPLSKAEYELVEEVFSIIKES